MSALDGLEIFVAVCDEGSIAAAGRRLGMPRATLSRQLSRLEADLGIKLLHRSTRRLVRTEAGQELYRRARSVVDDAISARQAVRSLDDVPRGALRISVPGDLSGAVHKLIVEYLDLYPETQIEVVSAARHVDLVGEGFDLAIRAGAASDPSLIGRPLIHSRVQVFGSPAYLKANGVPKTVAELADHACIRMFAAGTTPATHWPLLRGGTVRVQGRLACNTIGMAVAAITAGHGLGLLPDLVLLNASGLVPVLQHEVGTRSSLMLVYPERATRQPKVRAFVELAIQRLKGTMAATGAA